MVHEQEQKTARIELEKEFGRKLTDMERIAFLVGWRARTEVVMKDMTTLVEKIRGREG